MIPFSAAIGTLLAAGIEVTMASIASKIIGPEDLSKSLNVIGF